jgi:hypothetical protein
MGINSALAFYVKAPLCQAAQALCSWLPQSASDPIIGILVSSGSLSPCIVTLHRQRGVDAELVKRELPRTVHYGSLKRYVSFGFGTIVDAVDDFQSMLFYSVHTDFDDRYEAVLQSKDRYEETFEELQGRAVGGWMRGRPLAEILAAAPECVRRTGVFQGCLAAKAARKRKRSQA